MFSDATWSDINVVLCYVLSQYHSVAWRVRLAASQLGSRKSVLPWRQVSKRQLIFWGSPKELGSNFGRKEAEMQWWAKWQLSTFDLYPWGEGHGLQGQICDILRPQLAMSRFLPLWPHRFPHIHLGGGGVGGALILDRGRAFDLFASVDAHFWRDGSILYFPSFRRLNPYLVYFLGGK